MSLWFAAVLGLVQGLTEFLPISSTGHLRILPALLGQPDPGAAFSAVIQLGTLAAVLVYFWRDLFVKLPRAILVDRKSDEARMALGLILGTIPIVVAGLALKDFVDSEARSLYIVSGALFGFGAVMIAVDKKAVLNKTVSQLSVRHAVYIGIAQAGALIPGVSRSGATIVCALALGYLRPDAARFSFLLGVPAIAGAGIFSLKDAAGDLGSSAWPAIIVGTAVAFVSGLACIAWLMRYLGRRTLTPFGIYRMALAGLLIALIVAKVVES